jgi:pyruvate formate lyase activating enzyme
MTCKFCQNWQISQSSPEDVRAESVSPSGVVRLALKHEAASIAFTYGEPAVFYEYMYDIASLARDKGLASVVVTNGYYSARSIEALCGVVDAVKIDLKAFTEKYYNDICGASLAPVLGSLKAIRKSGKWLEIVYLMVPSLNDDPGEIRSMSRWIVSELGPDVPVHFSRFFPRYRLANLPPTPLSSLETAYGIAKEEGIRYVYVGNVPRHSTESTFCHNCGHKVISRSGYKVDDFAMTGGACDNCGTSVPGLWGKV